MPHAIATSILRRIRSSLIFALLAGAIAVFPAEPKPESKPRPAKIKVSGYGILGNRKLKRLVNVMQSEDIKKPLLDANFIENAGLIILSRVREDGFLNPTIIAEMVLEDGRNYPMRWHATIDPPLPRPLSVRRVQFRVLEGQRFYFDQLTFTGLDAMSEKQARSFFIETDALIPLKNSRIFTPGRLKRGLSSIREFLERKGFQDARAEAGDIRQDDKTGAVNVRVDVHQGPLYLVRSVRIETFITATNTPIYVENRRPNHPFSQLWQQDLVQSLKVTNYVGGYADTTVAVSITNREPIQSFGVPPSGGSTNSTRFGVPPSASPTNTVFLDLLAVVHTGPQIAVNAVRFSGNKETKTAIMGDRVELEPGDLLNPALAEKGRARLARLGVFDSVQLRYDIVDDEKRDVIYNLREGKSLDFNVLFGFGSYELLRGGIEVEKRNLWGRAHSVRLRAIQSFKSTRGDLLYTMPQFAGEEIDLFLNAFGLRREEVDFIRKEYGGGMGGLKHFPEIHTDLSVRYNYQVLEASDIPASVAARSVDNPGVGAIIADFRHDRRDSPIYPTRGYKVFSTFEFASEYLAGDVDYERLEIAAAIHHPLGGGRFISAGVSHGLIAALDSAAEDIPFNKRFFPGGEYSIRGYKEGEAAPRDAKGEIVGAESYIFGSIQFEQALTPKLSLVVFTDAVGFARDFADYPVDESLYTVGGGLNWKSIVGPIRLEYGYNLNPRPFDPVGTLHFSLGFPF